MASTRWSDTPPRIGRYTTTWRRDEGRWTIAALLVTGVEPIPPAALPPGLPLIKEPARAAGAAGPFVAADLAFARLAGERGAAVAFRRWAASESFTLGGGGLTTRGPAAIGSAVAGPAEWRWHPVLSGASQGGDMEGTPGLRHRSLSVASLSSVLGSQQRPDQTCNEEAYQSNAIRATIGSHQLSGFPL